MLAVDPHIHDKPKMWLQQNVEGAMKYLFMSLLLVLVGSIFGVARAAEEKQVGYGVSELSNVYAATKEVENAEITLKEAKGEDAIAKAKADLIAKKAILADAKEKVRPILAQLGKDFPGKEMPVSKEKCYMARPLFGDLVSLGSWFENWSVGTSVSTQLVRYNFSSKKASINTNVGAGVSFRYYGNSSLGDGREVANMGFSNEDMDLMKKNKNINSRTGDYQLPLYRIAPACRANTSDFGKERKEKLAGSIFSITPTLYASKQENSADASVQPALLVGFLDDIINVGAGFNLTGPDTGKVFLVFSLGYGFQF